MGLNELYNSIVDDVVENVKEAFSEEGVDEQILKSLKEAWLRRIRESQQPRQSAQQQQQLQHRQQQPQQSQLQQPQNHQPQQIQHTTQTSVIVFNNNISNSNNNNNNNNINANSNYNNLQPPPRANDNINTSTALNLSQHHRQQLVAEGTESNQRTQQQHGDKTNSNTAPHLPQLDGSNGISDDDDNDDESDGDFPDGDDDVDVSDEEDKETDTNREDEDPLNSGDDVSNDESSEMFETENVVVCQYDKITRNRNKWKFHLKDGMMNINGRDYVFQKAVGDAEW